TVSPIFEPGNAPKIETESKPVIIPGTGTEVALLGVDIENEQAALSITPTSAVIDVSVKPFISLLWIGSVLALIGGCIAVWRRMAESSESDEKPKTKKVSPRKPVHT
ncbi:MAG TPA: hypothetical protein PLZ21_12845, partial [Armatimonadota bacterium]|nr:hypothetical protein [Armatimonadota bacterium]